MDIHQKYFFAKKTFCIIFIIIQLFTISLQSQQVIKGKITDALTNEPVVLQMF